MKQAPVLLAMACCLCTSSRAASPPAPPANLIGCTRMADPSERLRCYDTQMTAMGAPLVAVPPSGTQAPLPAAPLPVKPLPPAPAGAVASVVPPPAPPTPAAKFGEEDLKQSARTPQTESDKVLLSRITSIHEARPKLFIIVLANGQIWMQEGTQITMFFRPGYDVRIDKGLFGHYRMSTAQTGEKNWVTVSRIQ
jgi:hypothetical protein